MHAQEEATDTFSCQNCGADLKYQPGTKSLVCQYCGTTNQIEPDEVEIEEIDFLSHLDLQPQAGDEMSIHAAKCNKCGATSSLDKDLKSALCPYCANPLIIDDAHTEHFLKPKSLLPFKLTADEATVAFKKWIKKLWFAPNALKKNVLRSEHFKGVYLPYWTYDTDTYTRYTGMRGDYYYETETYTTTENGKTVTKTRQVRKTRWWPASGSVSHFFDDILVVASNALPRTYVNKLEPWDLHNLTPFNEKYLSGFITEKYQLDLKGGFEQAKDDIQPAIDSLIRSDIGGDEQRILSKKTKYDRITFKHLLLPTYISAFWFKKKLYRFIVNARTGEVQGERPWSWIKITLAILLAIILLAAAFFVYNEYTKQH